MIPRSYEVYAINQAGQVTGLLDTSFHAAIFENGGATDLGTLFGFGSRPYAINAAGAVVGSVSTNAQFSRHAFAYDAGRMLDMNSFSGLAESGWVLEDATGINDNGQIVGNGRNAQGEFRGFIASLDTTVWSGSLGGSWDSVTGWSYGARPSASIGAVIDPSRSLSITGPQSATQVRSLTLGGSAGVATLYLAGGTIEVLGQGNLYTQINPKGVLAGDGAITGVVTNLGRVEATNLTLADGLNNQGVVTGHGILSTSLTNTVAGTVQLGAGQSLLLTGGTHSNAGLVQLTNGGGTARVGQLQQWRDRSGLHPRFVGPLRQCRHQRRRRPLPAEQRAAALQAAA